MIDQGVDYSLGRPNLDQLWAAGYRFVFRYLSWRPNAKCITPAELADLLGHGFQVALNWEYDALDALGGAPAGQAHGAEAVAQAQALGYPRGCTIYFSADFDETEAQAPTVEAYMRAAGAEAHGGGYRMGAYGGYYTIKRLLDAAAIDDAWQAYAWSGGQWDPRAAMRQVLNGQTIAGADCDIDERHAPTHLMGEDDMTPEEHNILAATDNRLRQSLILGHDTFDDTPGAGPEQTVWIVSQLKAMAADIAAIKAGMGAPADHVHPGGMTGPSQPVS